MYKRFYAVHTKKVPLYEDNVKMESWRYSEAKKVVQDLIKNGSAYDFRTHGFNRSVLRSLDRLCGIKHP